MAGGFVVGAEFLVEVGRADEEKASGGDDRATIVFCAGVGLALCGQLRILAEGNLPNVFPGIQIDGVERAPGRSHGGIALRIEKFAVAGEAEFHRQQGRRAF